MLSARSSDLRLRFYKLFTTVLTLENLATFCFRIMTGTQILEK